MSSTTTDQATLESSIENLSDKLTSLTQSLESHPLFYLNPRPKLLDYTHDFVRRTLHTLAPISVPALAAKEPQAREAYQDVAARCIMAQMIICDESGKTGRMMTIGDEPVDFGEEIRNGAEAVLGAVKNEL